MLTGSPLRRQQTTRIRSRLAFVLVSIWLVNYTKVSIVTALYVVFLILLNLLLCNMSQIMIPYDYPGFVTDLTYLVEKNYIPMSRIDDAVRRILRVKFTLGLFESPYADHSLVDEIGKKVSHLLRDKIYCDKIFGA